MITIILLIAELYSLFALLKIRLELWILSAMKKNIFVKNAAFLLASALLFVSCSKKSDEAIVSESENVVEEPSAEEIALEKARKEEERLSKAISDYTENLSQTEKLSQLFLVNLQGKEDFAPVEFEGEKAIIPGGYIFFSFNIASTASEIIGFTDSVASYCENNSLVPPYLSIDQEGGLVNRLRGITSSVPSCRTIAANYSEKEAAALYESQAKQLSLLGFHLNLAPVAEAVDDENRDFLGTRSYGDVAKVKKYASIAVRSYEQNAIGTVLKHFPGNTNTDPHTGLPEIEASDEKLREMIVEPFKAIIDSANPAAVLMSHARTAAHDAEKPACFSRYWVSDVLRGEMAFSGLIFSDDIFMAALEKNGYPPEKAVVMAIEAGVDCIMLSEKRFKSVLEVLRKKAQEDETFAEKLDEALNRVIRFKLREGVLLLETAEDGESATIVNAKRKSAEERLSAFEEEKQKGDSYVK